MRVAELMQQPVVTVELDTPVREAVVALTDDHISAVPVIDRTGRMVGVVSSTDILTAEAEAEDDTARESLFAATPVRDIMTARPLTVTPETDVKDAAQQMLYAEVHRLFVVEADRVVGVLSTSDIVRAVATGRL
ncbi:MAG TPA: CBS domain-containing protein [Gemmatimonadales bacterium]|jgi:CBS domain-containing protein